MPRSREENAARMREQREAEARAQKEVDLQSEVMPNLRLERNEARAKARSEARSAVTQKKLADEVAAFAAAIAPVPPEEEACSRFLCDLTKRGTAPGKSHVRFNGSPNSHSTIRPRKAR